MLATGAASRFGKRRFLLWLSLLFIFLSQEGVRYAGKTVFLKSQSTTPAAAGHHRLSNDVSGDAVPV